MCNAQNHPPGCSCGWGGVWYGSHNDDASWLFNRSPPPRKLGPQKGTFQTIAGSHTRPNSKCPVCNAPVYYYESPYGGKVFFDELGPPWPKHPCTDNDIRNGATKTPVWHQSDWKPLWQVSIEKIDGDAKIFKLLGFNSKKSYEFFFRSEELVTAEIVRTRQVGKGVMEVSILDFHATKGAWTTWEGLIYTQEKIAKLTAVALINKIIHAQSGINSRQPASPHPQKESELFSSKSQISRNHNDSNLKNPEQITSFEKNAILLKCPDCASSVAERNFLKHIRRTHGYVPLGTVKNISGRLILTQSFERQ